MTLPDGITTTTITFGTAVTMISKKNLAMSVTFTPTTSLVWAATGTVLIADAEGFTADPGQQGSVSLINPDQDGFTDGNGSTIRNWGYKVEAKYTDGGTVLLTAPPKYITWTATDTGPIDLDQMIPVTAASGITLYLPDEWSNNIADLQGRVAAIEAGNGSGGGGTGGAVIVDSTTATTSVWSSSKTNTTITAAKARSSHTGTQLAATISDFTEAAQDVTAAMLRAGTNVTVAYDDAAGTFTINATGGGTSSTGPAVILTAANDGSADVTAAINTAANVAATTGLPLFIPAGNYRAEQGVNIPAGVAVHGAGEQSRIYGNRPNTYIMQVRSGTTVQDVMVENTYTDGCAGIDIAANSSNVRFDRVRFKGIHAQTLNINAAGISDISVDRCRFVDVGYGILTNEGANDLTNIRITNSTFLNVYADAIEFNHPAGGEPAATGFLVEGCTIQVPNGAGSGSTGGFGVGAAGVGDLRIIGNLFLPSRREAIHVEDTSRRVIITGNTINGISGADASGGIVIYADVKSTIITGNTLTNVSKTGILMIYDTNPTGDYDVLVSGNTIDTVVEHGISVAGEWTSGDRFIVTNNLIRNAGYDGIDILGMHHESVITGNIIDTCARWGILAADPAGVPPRLRLQRQNVITNCGSGDYYATGIGSGNATVIHDRYAALNPTTTSTGASLNVPLFRVGEYASGKVVVQGRRTDANNTRADAVFQIGWDGTTLTATRALSKTNVGTVEFTNLALIAGILNVVTTVGAAGVTLEVAAQFEGLILETNESYTGTITGTAPLESSAGTGTPASTYQYLRMVIASAQPSNDGGFQLSELQFLDSGSAPITGATVSLSGVSVPNVTYEGPTSLNDGNLTTKLFATPASGTILYTFPAPVAAKSYRWATATDVPGRDPYTWTIQGSADGATWTTLDTVTGYVATTERSTYQPVRSLTV